MHLIDMQKQEYPLASFCIVAYNQEKYIREAVQAAFDQDYPNLEIILSDDASSDCTFKIMSDMAAAYKGPHKIVINKNVSNMGCREHFNNVLYNISKGEFLFLAAGDDISRYDRVSKCVDLMKKHPDVMSMSVKSQFIDANGNSIALKEWDHLSEHSYSLYTLADYIGNKEFYIYSGDSRVLRRSVIDHFPPLSVSRAEDIFLFLRSFYIGNVIYFREPLVKYRQHSDSIMGEFRNKRPTKDAIKNWINTTEKQLYLDYQYAVENSYLNHSESSCMLWKLESLIAWLKPQRKSLMWRAVHRISKYTNLLFVKMLKMLE